MATDLTGLKPVLCMNTADCYFFLRKTRLIPFYKQYNALCSVMVSNQCTDVRGSKTKCMRVNERVKMVERKGVCE